MEKKYNLENRLITYAADIIIFVKSLGMDDVGRYYGHQLLRSGGSSALNFGETQGTRTNKDYIFKISLVIKEIKESKVNLKILTKAALGQTDLREKLLDETIQLDKILGTIRRNKQNLNPKS